jgi:hypothetical protein
MMYTVYHIRHDPFTLDDLTIDDAEAIPGIYGVASPTKLKNEISSPTGFSKGNI